MSYYDLIRDIAYTKPHSPFHLAVFLYGDFKKWYYEPDTEVIYDPLPYDVFLCEIASELTNEFHWDNSDIVKFMEHMHNMVPKEYEELLFT